MKTETLKALEAFFEKAPTFKAEAVSQKEIEEAFRCIPFVLSCDYRGFVEAYGGAIVGPYRVYGLRRAPAMGVKEGSALDVTERFAKQRWPGVDRWLVISIDHSGNPIGLASDDKVWISDHDFGGVSCIAPSFEEFIRQWCLNFRD